MRFSSNPCRTNHCVILREPKLLIPCVVVGLPFEYASTQAVDLLGEGGIRGAIRTMLNPGKAAMLATIVVVARPGSGEGQPPPGWSWVRVEVPRLEVSSTDLRARVVEGRPLDYLLSAAVIETIECRGLYKEPVNQ